MKNILKIKEGKVLFGVCTGLARHLNMQLWIVRAIFVLLTAFVGIGPLAYIILAILMGKED